MIKLQEDRSAVPTIQLTSLRRLRMSIKMDQDKAVHTKEEAGATMAKVIREITVINTVVQPRAAMEAATPGASGLRVGTVAEVGVNMVISRISTGVDTAPREVAMEGTETIKRIPGLALLQAMEGATSSFVICTYLVCQGPI